MILGAQNGGSDDFKIFHLNCQGLNTPFDFLFNLANLNFFHVLVLTETWLGDHNSALPGYTGVHFAYTRNRELRQYGGLVAYDT